MSKSVRLGAGQSNSTYSSGGRSNSFGVQYGNKLAGLPPSATGPAHFMRLYKIKSYPRRNFGLNYVNGNGTPSTSAFFLIWLARQFGGS